MYTEKHIQALDLSNFDFTEFDWQRAKADLKEAAESRLAQKQARKLPKNGGIPYQKRPEDSETPYGRVLPKWNRYIVRYLHVTYSMARGRPIVGERGIESINTEDQIQPAHIQGVLEIYKQEGVNVPEIKPSAQVAA